MAGDGDSSLHADGEHADGCLCGVQIDSSEMVSDKDLPVASGGVLAEAPDDSGADNLDGCLCDSCIVDVTSDAELPPSVGGVA